MNKSKLFRNKKVIEFGGYEYGIVEGRVDIHQYPSIQKISSANFMGNYNWALQWCKKIKTIKS